MPSKLHITRKNIKAIILIFIATIPFNYSIAQDFQRVENLAKIDHIQNNSGVAVADYDQDGDLDIFLVGIASFDPLDETTWNRLLRNNDDGTFEDVTLAVGFDAQFINVGLPARLGEKFGAAWGDCNNDGYPDLFLTNSRFDQLYYNERGGTFFDVTALAGVAGCFDCISTSALWWDHDRDGDLDLYVSVFAAANRMYENIGDFSFEDITDDVLLGDEGAAWASVPIDVDGDGWLDLYVVNDFFDENQLYRNLEGQRFVNATSSFGLGDGGDGMGVAIGDYNNDSFFDIYVTNIFSRHANPLFTNLSNRGFTDKAVEMGVDNSGWGWGTHFLDYDHDGDEDLFAVNGVGKVGVIFDGPKDDVNNFFFRNTLDEGIEGFLDWSHETGTADTVKSRGLEVFDYDGDGDLDLLVANVEDRPYLYRNDIIAENQPESANWIKIWLEGTASNRDAIGTKVKLTLDGQSFYRWHHGAGFLAQSLKPVHFGLASAQIIDEIQVTWPLGQVQTFQNIAANRTIRITEGETTTAVEDVFAEEVAFLVTSLYPNPFVNSVNIGFDLNKAGLLELKIFSMTGREVYRQRLTVHSAGFQEIIWHARDMGGNFLPSGVYFYTADFGGHRIIAKMVKL